MSHARCLAGIDIGTLTCRLLIAEYRWHLPFHELHAERRILRLGEGVDGTRRLCEDAMTRVLTCLAEWRTVLDRYKVEALAVVATSAVRDAANQAAFVDRVKQETGLEIEVLSGAEEARQTLLGLRSGLPAGVTDVLALDIGGGSTEFIYDRGHNRPLVRSLDLGVVRLCERVLRHDPPTEAEIAEARAWVAEETRSIMPAMEDHARATFVGTAGTVTALATMAQRLPRYDPARIHQYKLQLDRIRELEQVLLTRSSANRPGIVGLEKGREDVIVAGALIIRTVMETLGRSSVLVSNLGLREGLLVDLACRMGWHASAAPRMSV